MPRAALPRAFLIVAPGGLLPLDAGRVCNGGGGDVTDLEDMFGN